MLEFIIYDLIPFLFFAILFCIGAVILGWGLLFVAAVGWIPILMVAFDPNLTFGFHDQATGVEEFAMAGVCVYALIFVIWVLGSIYMALTGRELPALFKAFAWMFPHPAQSVARRGTSRSLDSVISGTELATKLQMKPSTIFGFKIQTHNSKKVAEELRAEKEWLKGQENIAREAVETEISRTRAKTYNELRGEARASADLETRRAAVASHAAKRAEILREKMTKRQRDRLVEENPYVLWALDQLPKDDKND